MKSGYASLSRSGRRGCAAGWVLIALMTAALVDRRHLGRRLRYDAQIEIFNRAMDSPVAGICGDERGPESSPRTPRPRPRGSRHPTPARPSDLRVARAHDERERCI